MVWAAALALAAANQEPSRDDAGTLLRQCEGSNVSYCMGYVTGTLHGYSVTQDTLPVQARICVPETARINQGVAIVVAYLKEKPETWHLPPQGAVINALLRVWRCKT